MKANLKMSNKENKALNQLINVRIDKLNKIKERGYNPYPHIFVKEDKIVDIIKNIDEKKKYKTAGRIISLRKMGKASFLHILGSKEKIQVYVKTDLLPDSIYDDIVRNLDLGDIIGVEGTLFYTRTKELTLQASNIILLTKSIRPLPNLKEKDGKVFFAFDDKELKYRKRYLDLIANKKVKEVFIKRSQIVNNIRIFLNSIDFLEVETPILQPLYGGAFAKPFETYHNSLDRKLYLRIADELYLKRLIIGGIERVYEIGKDFRNEGIDRTHNPEFTMLEFYKAYSDVYDMANIVETMIKTIVKNLKIETINFNDNNINLNKEFNRVSFYDILEKHMSISIKDLSIDEIYKIINVKDVKIEENLSKGKLLDKLFSIFVEPNLIEPTFVFDYPIEISPLAKHKRDGAKDIVERFELFVGGYELANSFSELNDPIDQKNRFLEQIAEKSSSDENMKQLDNDFLEAIEIGMPPTGGVGIGIDRLVMMLTSTNNIKDVILFPTLKTF